MKKLFRNLVILCLFFIAIYLFIPSLKQGECNKYHEFLKIEFKGILVKKNIDRKEHSYPIISIKNFRKDSIINVNLSLDTTDFFDVINVGDTLLKTKNSSWIYREEAGVFTKYKSINFDCK